MEKRTQQLLLKLARQALEHYFDTKKVLKVEVSDEEPKEKRGTFVTLHTKPDFAKATPGRNGQLRGCIGHIEPVQEIYKDVIENALAAAFEDTRFAPLEKREMEDIKIEISVLTKPEQLVYSSPDDLLNKLQPLCDGVIIRKGRYGATYLPQVWEDISDKAEFLSSLCLKAGLAPDEWRTDQLEVLTYQAEVFYES